MFRSFLSAFACLGLCVACSPTADEAEGARSYPALWQIAREDGMVEGWLFGTVHSLPDDMAWRSPRLEEVVQQADTLVVEVADLEDREAMAALFESMAYDRVEGPVRDRVREDLQDEFDALIVKAKVRRAYFDSMESWAAALALAQAANPNRSGSGADRELIADFADRPLVELEGAREQLEIFDRLPPPQQRDLLDAVLEEASAQDRTPGRVANVWGEGNIEELEALTQAGMLADPELRAALLVDRNEAWAARLENLLSAPSRPLIAVGAGHLLGEAGLPALLRERGYVVTRVE
ncbi:TraB/GumN family protein [Qipengyuania sp. XHP0207]|uniref:TraB/GumN family protein n=1 Tax=Qipengyuania sp. XHP0207 TaxID=3038078 RepID=UPI00241D53D8|nr:TraB/GumN family protein [Qipengyuania sp. XHP0207]MDG5749403.1 TraB/GumN family protein [Qipengyuania sp. XHP0207]